MTAKGKLAMAAGVVVAGVVLFAAVKIAIGEPPPEHRPGPGGDPAYDPAVRAAIDRNNQGHLLGKLGMLDEDIAKMRKQIEANPSEVRFYRELAILLIDAGKEEEALEAYRQGLKVNPNDSLAHADFARLLIRYNKMEEAVSEVATASAVLANMDVVQRVSEVQPGMKVVDVGAGSGRYTVPWARWVGEGGKVFAVDIQEESVQLITAVGKGLALPQIVPSVCESDNIGLPAGSVDIAWLSQVYTHVASLGDDGRGADPWVKSIAESVNATGKILITGESPTMMSMAERHFGRFGFKLKETVPFLQEGPVMVFVRK